MVSISTVPGLVLSPDLVRFYPKNTTISKKEHNFLKLFFQLFFNFFQISNNLFFHTLVLSNRDLSTKSVSDYYRFSNSAVCWGPKNRTNRGPPVYPYA